MTVLVLVGLGAVTTPLDSLGFSSLFEDVSTTAFLVSPVSDMRFLQGKVRSRTIVFFSNEQCDECSQSARIFSLVVFSLDSGRSSHDFERKGTLPLLCDLVLKRPDEHLDGARRAVSSCTKASNGIDLDGVFGLLSAVVDVDIDGVLGLLVAVMDAFLDGVFDRLVGAIVLRDGVFDLCSDLVRPIIEVDLTGGFGLPSALLDEDDLDGVLGLSVMFVVLDGAFEPLFSRDGVFGRMSNSIDESIDLDLTGAMRLPSVFSFSSLGLPFSCLSVVSVNRRLEFRLLFHRESL